MTGRSAVGAAGYGLLVLMCTGGPAAAFDISEPEVEKGLRQIETIHVTQSGFPGGSVGNTRNFQTLSYAYGVTDVWQLKGGLYADRLDDRDWEVSTAFVESTFELMKWKQTGGFGLAWFTSVGGATVDDATNVATFGPILKFANERLALTLNPFLEKTFGQNHETGIAFTYGWQLGARIQNGVVLAIAGFGAIDNLGDPPALQDQEHKIGPIVSFEHEINEKQTLTLELGAFAGLTNATADQALKVKLTYGF